MGKSKLTAETLLDKCSNEHCQYNERHFCNLGAIMLDEDGKCIYATGNAGNTKQREE